MFAFLMMYQLWLTYCDVDAQGITKHTAIQVLFITVLFTYDCLFLKAKIVIIYLHAK